MGEDEEPFTAGVEGLRRFLEVKGYAVVRKS